MMGRNEVPGGGRPEQPRRDHASREDTEPVESDQLSTGRLKSLSKIPRELSEEELATPGAQRMLLSLLDRLGSEVELLDHYRDRFHNF